jgi:alpha-galactosidase
VKPQEQNARKPQPIFRFPFFVLVAFFAVSSAQAITNNLALTPAMGWNDWNSYHCGINESAVTNTANVIVANGMAAAGYQFVNIDDGWASSRDSNGVIQAYSISTKFPHGIAWLADYVHSVGLKLGVYTDHGTNTCSSCISGQTPPKQPGSYGYEYVDAMTYGSWSVDYLKNDSCNLPANDIPTNDYFRMADGLMKSGHPILSSLCPNAAHYEYWSPDAGNSWRTTGDINSTFASMISKIDQNSKSAYLAGPGRWNDPDMLEIGNGEFVTNLVAAQTHFTMWCMMAAPLIAGNNVITMSSDTLAVLTNSEAIAVDQDPAGEQAERVGGIVDTAEVWSKPLGYDFMTRAVALLNRSSNSSAVITCNWTNLAFQQGTATVRDLWTHQDLGTFTNSFTATIPSYGSMLLKIVGVPIPPPPLGTNYLTGLQPIYAYCGFGAMTNNKSIGGNPITLEGVVYTNGIGTHAIGGNEYNLGGVCSRFHAVIGVDDEVGNNGSVIFQVLADGTKIYDSGIMTGGTLARTLDLDITGVRRLTLGVTDTGNDVSGNRNSNDHSDWANAWVVVTNTTPQVPHAPTGLVAAPGNNITLTWNTGLAALNYIVKRSTTNGGSYTTIAKVPVTTFTDTNATLGTTYYYVVSALSSVGESSDSAQASATPCNVPLPPATVTTTVTNTQIRVTWSASSGATSYTASRFTGSTPPVTLATGLATTNFTDTTVTPGVTYYYTVAAANTCNASPPSAFVAGTVPAAAPSIPVWNGGSSTGNFWSDSANWNGTNITPGSALIFDGTLRRNNTNDTLPVTLYSGFTFNPAAGAFVLNGNAITLGGDIADNSPNPQVINLGLNFSNSLALNGTAGSLTIARGLTNTFGAPGSTTLTLTGTGIITNMLSSTTTPGGTNILATSGFANWTLTDNPLSASSTVPWVLSINSGTFNFGSGSSAPVLNTTTPNNIPSDNQVGTVSGATGTFNILAGVLTTASRLNTATALNSTGIVNQVGGTFNLGSQFQGANGANAGEVSLLNLTGGTMNIAGGGGPCYVASRGSGTLTISGSAALNCSTLDVSRNANGNAIGSVGSVNLNGGTILASKVGTATSASQTGTTGNPAPSATFYFNGGILKINSSTAPFFQGSTVAPVIPISAIVKSGGAFIDTNGKTNSFAEPLLHDPGLGSTPDGGLTKNGSGSLLLAAAVGYTGSTIVNAGTLALTGSVALTNSPLLTVAAGATLDASGRSDQTLTLVNGETLNGNGSLNGSVVSSAGSTVAPSGSPGTLSFNNNLTLNAGSTTLLKINKSALTNDQLQVNGILAYSGTLVATNISATQLNANDQFKLFNAASYSAQFTSIVPPMPGSSLAWDTSNLTTNGTLRVVPATPPRLSASISGTNLVLTVSKGIPSANCYILIGTNLNEPLSSWSRLATNTFDLTGLVAFTNTISRTNSSRFFRVQLP